MAKCKTTVILFFLLLGAVVISPVYAATIEVHPGESIQAAINQAVSGDTVFVFSGLYPEDLVIKDGVNITGESYNSVVISGRISFQDSSSTLRDITIIFPEGNFLTYINTYYDGFSLQDDAGITIINSAPIIQNCVIMPTLEHYGKGIQIWNMYNNPDVIPQIRNNIITDTEIGIYYFAQAFGGAILGQIKNNTLYHNKNGITLRMHKEKPEIKNNIIMDGDSGIFLTYADGTLLDERKSLVHHNDIWSTLHKYWLDENSSEFDLTTISGNISADPLFVNPNNYDFSLDTGSPCIGQADDGGNMGAQLTAPSAPSAPQIEPLPVVINQRYITIEGIKDINSSIVINGEEYIPIDSETTWTIPSYDLGIDGDKILLISSKNIYGLESSGVTVNITLDTTPPEIAITLPTDGATFDTTPITVSGTINELCDVLVNGVLATIDGNTFTATGVNLKRGSNTITATAYDIVGNHSEDSVAVTSTVTSDYNLTKETSDVYEYDPTQIIAGSQYSLKIHLEIDGVAAANEPIQFLVTQGAGSMVQSIVNTNTSGEATGVLNADVNASITNLVEVFDQNFSSKKVTFHIDTKEGSPANLVKITDDRIHPVPGSEVDLIVKLEDVNNNPIPSSEISYQITSGPGTLSSSSDITNDYGNAHIILTTTSNQGTLCVIEARLTSNPSINATFNITTSSFSPVTVSDIMAKVAANNQLIQDVIAYVDITSNAPWSPTVSQLKIWQKDNKQKVQELSPNPGIYIRPNLQGVAPQLAQNITSFNPISNEYVIKSTIMNQVTEKPYELLHIDFSKGIVTKVELFQDVQNEEIIQSTEYMDFVQIPEASNAWIYNTKIEKFWQNGQLKYTTTKVISDRAVNTDIPDSEF